MMDRTPSPPPSISSDDLKLWGFARTALANFYVRLAILLLGVSSVFVAGAINAIGYEYVPIINKTSFLGVVAFYSTIFSAFIILVRYFFKVIFAIYPIEIMFEKEFSHKGIMFIKISIFLLTVLFYVLVAIYFPKMLPIYTDNEQFFDSFSIIDISKFSYYEKSIVNLSITFLFFSVFMYLMFYVFIFLQKKTESQSYESVKIVFKSGGLGFLMLFFIMMVFTTSTIWIHIVKHYGPYVWIHHAGEQGSPIRGSIVMPADQGFLAFVDASEKPHYFSWHRIEKIEPILATSEQSPVAPN